MGIKTGNPRGRPTGSHGKRTIHRDVAIRQAQAIIDHNIPGAFEGDSYAFLLSVYKDPSQELDQRIKCAMTTIKYERPALSNVELTGKDGGAIELTLIDRLQRGIARVKGNGDSKE